MGPRQRFFEVVTNVLVKGLVFVVGDLVFRPGPECARLIDGFLFVTFDLLALFLIPFFLLHQNRLHDVIGVLADQALELPAREQVILIRTQMQHDICAARSLFGLLNRVGTRGIAAHAACPTHPFRGRCTRTAGEHGDRIRDDEGRIKADPELTDQIGVVLLIAGQFAEELAGTRFGDRAKMGDHLITAHADPVIRHRQGPGLLVECDANLEIAVPFEQIGVIQRFEAQLVARIGRIGDQFAQEDLAIGVQRVNHQVQQLLDFCLKIKGLDSFSLRSGHRLELL